MRNVDAKKILIVDDDKQTLKMLKIHLENKGFKVVTSQVPFIGPLLMNEKPDLIILDVNMPLLSGDRLFNVMKHNEFYSRVPVIFFSARSDEYLSELVMKTGATDYVQKEKGMDALVRKIKEIINQ